jgi:hypothetical protein
VLDGAVWGPQPNHDQPDRIVSTIVGVVSWRPGWCAEDPAPEMEGIVRPVTMWVTPEEWSVCADHVMTGMHALWVVGGSMHGRTGVHEMTLEVKRLNHEGTCSTAAATLSHPHSLFAHTRHLYCGVKHPNQRV